MSTPEDNPEGYNSSRVFNYLENLRKKQFLLMHGTKDDNVHYQQSMLLSAALEEKDILFRQQSYPDQAHSISRYHQHLYHTITDFLLNQCFVKKQPWEEPFFKYVYIYIYICVCVCVCVCYQINPCRRWMQISTSCLHISVWPKRPFNENNPTRKYGKINLKYWTESGKKPFACEML